MFVLLLVIASARAGQDELQVVESVRQDYFRQPPPGAIYIPPTFAEDAGGPHEVNFPVKTVQRFVDSDGNVQVVTSYSNRNDNPLPIYKSKPINQFDIEDKSGITIPQGRSILSETEERSVPKAQQMQRTKTVKLPGDRGQYVENEEKSTYSDGNSQSFSKVSSYDNSYKPPVSVKSSQARSGSPYDSVEQPSFRRRKLPKVNVPAQSISTPVRILPDTPTFRSIKESIENDRSESPISRSANADHALEAEGTSYVSDIEEATAEEDDGYDEVYEEHPLLGPVPHGLVGVHGPHGLHGPPAHPVIAIGPGHGVPIGGVVGIGGGVGGGLGGGAGHSHSYDKKDAQGYNHGEQFAKGEKGAKGHKTNESYDKGHVEKHGHEHNKGGKKEEIGEKKGHLDEHNSYHKGHSHHKGEKGKEKSHSKGHKKGHKTSGFRTVHHKDEYKKDEVFYDEEHDAGHEKIKAHEEGAHQEAKGGESKKGHLNSGYKDAVKGVEGEKKEGQTYDISKGHSAHSGHKASEGHSEGFNKAGGHKGEEAHGHVFKKAGGGGWA